MLTIRETHGNLTRRDLLTIGSLWCSGLGLASLLRRSAVAGEAANPITGKSVVFVFQQGGPSQHETFDPKPEAPSEIRTVGDVIPTSLPGVHFGQSMSQLAKLADKCVTVRSFATGNGGHNLKPIVGDASLDANIGVHYARVAGMTHPTTGVPTNTVLFPASVDNNVPRPSARGDIDATGPYSSKFAPFIPGQGGQLQSDMRINLSRDRLFEDRQALLNELDRLNRDIDRSGLMESLDESQRQAYQVLLGGGVQKALDLSREDQRTLAMYDTSGFSGGTKWNKVNRGKQGLYNGQATTIGKLMLQARRLCEAGCGYVTVHAGYAGVWDMHADGNNLNMKDGMEAVGRSFDHAIAAFIRDCEDRGLSDKILLVCCGEMGRTPRLNKRGGRDHWSRLAPLLMYGGGLAGGQVIGASDRQGGEPLSDGFNARHLVSTILNTVMKAEEVRLLPEVPAGLNEILAHPPIVEVGKYA